ncbi:hypothetical protein GCM10027403_05910 [Arthrobacter tecti]
MTWLQALPALFIAIGVFLIPGAILGRAVGLRGLILWAVAAPATVSVASITAIAAGALGVRWSVGLVGLSVIVLALLCLLLRFAVGVAGTHIDGRSTSPIRSVRSPELPLPIGVVRALSYVAAVVAPTVIITWRFMATIGSPANISQSYDNVYHLNAVRHILETGSASSLSLGSLTEAGEGFYPAGWHDMISLIVLATSTSIPVAVSLGNIVIGAVVWPLACMYMVSRITGMSSITILLTGVLAGGFAAFPYLMIDFGVLYPNLLSIALLPVALGIMISFLGVGVITAGLAHSVVLFLLVFPGLALAHPSTAIAMIAFGAPIVLGWVAYRTVQWRRRTVANRRMGLIFAFAGLYLGIGLVAWNLARLDPSVSLWDPRQTGSQAVGEVLMSAPQGAEASLALFALTILGLAILSMRPARLWIVGMFAVGLGLYVIASATGEGEFRHFWTGVWYNDANRLAALLPVVTLPVAVIGGEWALRRLAGIIRTSGLPSAMARRVSTPESRVHYTLPAMGLLAGIVLIGVSAQLMGVPRQQAEAAPGYRYTESSDLLSVDELAIFDAVEEHVPEDARVFGNPWTGASLVYAFTGRQTVAPHITGQRTEDENTLLEQLDEAGAEPGVCSAVRNTNTYFALDFGTREVGSRYHPSTAMDNAESAPGLELVARVGNAALYAVVACGPQGEAS